MQKIDGLEDRTTSITLTKGQKRFVEKMVKTKNLEYISVYIRELVQKEMERVG